MRCKWSFAVVGLLATFCMSNCLSSNKDEEETTMFEPRNVQQNFAPAMLSKASFCGEKIDLTNYYLKERFDRELLSFSYWHSQVFLMVKRANKYFPIIEPILKREGVPDDFKYLALIESNLDPRALSPAKAAGLWQILPDTGKEGGLEVNDDVDERYNVEKATVLACRYLTKTYELTNSWSLAAASYNTGRARVLRQMEVQKCNSYFDMLFSEETNRYVFRIILAKMIMENPSKFGFNLRKSDLYAWPQQTVVKVDTTIENLTDFAIANGSSYQLLKDANPWLRSNKLPNKSRKQYEIKITRKADVKIDLKNINIHNKNWVIDD